MNEHSATKNEGKSDNDKKGNENDIGELIKNVLEVVPDSPNKYDNERDLFKILMPCGYLFDVWLNPADTIQDLNKLVNKTFGENCLLIGVKKNRITQKTNELLCLGMFKIYGEQLSITSLSCQ